MDFKLGHYFNVIDVKNKKMKNPRLKKIIFDFLDDKFDDLELKQGDDDWSGFYNKDNKLVVGYDLNDSDAWYYEGGLWRVHSEAHFFNLEYREYIKIIKEYIKLKYGFYIRSLA